VNIQTLSSKEAEEGFTLWKVT